MLKNKLYQAFKKITSGVLDSRPALQCLHIDPDMSMTATDSYRMLRIENVVPDKALKEPLNLRLDTFTFQNDVNYPDVSKLVPSEFKETVTLNAEVIRVFRQFLKLPKSYIDFDSSGQDNCEILIEYNGITISRGKLLAQKIAVELDIVTPIKVTLNPIFLADGLEFIYEFLNGYTSRSEFQLGFNGKLQPIVLTAVNGDKQVANYLITPTRTF